MLILTGLNLQIPAPCGCGCPFPIDRMLVRAGYSILLVLQRPLMKIIRKSFWRTRQVSGWKRDARDLYRNRLEKLHWDVLEQDRHVLEVMAPDARNRELYMTMTKALFGFAAISRRKQKNNLPLRCYRDDPHK